MCTKKVDLKLTAEYSYFNWNLGRRISVHFKIHFCFSLNKHKHAQSHRRECCYRAYLVQCFSLAGLTMALICLLQREESRYHTDELHCQCASVRVRVCMHVCVFILYVCPSSVWVYLCACMSVYTGMCCVCVCAFAIQCTAQECVCLPLPFPLILTCKPLCVKVWDVSSGVWLWGDLNCGNIQVWDPSLSVGLTSDGKDLPRRLLTKPQLCMIQELSKRMPANVEARPFIGISEITIFTSQIYIQCKYYELCNSKYAISVTCV